MSSSRAGSGRNSTAAGHKAGCAVFMGHRSHSSRREICPCDGCLQPQPWYLPRPAPLMPILIAGVRRASPDAAPAIAISSRSTSVEPRLRGRAVPARRTRSTPARRNIACEITARACRGAKTRDFRDACSSRRCRPRRRMLMDRRCSRRSLSLVRREHRPERRQQLLLRHHRAMSGGGVRRRRLLYAERFLQRS